jgi:probable rRNA maturation factor
VAEPLKKLELNIAGDVPADLNLAPLERTVAMVNELQAPWLQSGVVNLKLVDDAAIKELNSKYSGNDEATDVLSFSYVEDGEPVEGELGDMVISLQTAERQADQAGTSLSEELALLVLHGCLHILGFDHQTGTDQQRLDNLQSDILSAANVIYRKFEWKH